MTYADEAHHSSANSYKKVMEYFTPKLWLGMTATPDKRDDNLEGRNIYEIFNHQIAYEIRLHEEGETARETIVREIREELDTEIQVEELRDTVEYDYPKFHLSMDCFICTVKSGDLVLKEHEAAKWLTKETLGSVEWLPADEGLIEKIREYIQKN